MVSLDTQETSKKLGSDYLFRYVLFATGLAFFNRAMPTPFLPLVIQDDFKQPMSVVGLTLALYPLGALAATPACCRAARRSVRIGRFHCWSIVGMVLAALVFAICSNLVDLIGPNMATVLVAGIRALQGATQALFIAANTTLITRQFRGNVAYVIGMAEVAVGVGAQIGRIVGGFLFDFGGFPAPFCTIAALQALCATAGFAGAADQPTEDAVVSSVAADGSTDVSAGAVGEAGGDMPLSTLLTPRAFTAVAGVFVAYLMTGLYDATYPPHLEVYLGPVSVAVVSIVSAVRNVAYLLVSYWCARLLQKDKISYECLIAIGFSCVIFGLVLVAPQGAVTSAVDLLSGEPPSVEPPRFSRWVVQITALMITSTGNAMLFVPSLPLMQSEVRHLGDVAVEQVGVLFMSAMSIGEASGPIFGGWLTDKLGFAMATGILAACMLPLLIFTLATYDGDVVRSRHRNEGDLGTDPTSPLVAATDPHAFHVPVDPEGAYLWRRIPSILVNEACQNVPGSAPSFSFRRQYNREQAMQALQQRPFMTNPSSTYRRTYSKEVITRK